MNKDEQEAMLREALRKAASDAMQNIGYEVSYGPFVFCERERTDAGLDFFYTIELTVPAKDGEA